MRASPAYGGNACVDGSSDSRPCDDFGMNIEVTTTPRETLLWAETPALADELRTLLQNAGVLVSPADSWELEFFNRIPEAEQHSFDPAKIIDVEIGANAHDALTAVVAAGHTVRWHPWQMDGMTSEGAIEILGVDVRAADT